MSNIKEGSSTARKAPDKNTEQQEDLSDFYSLYVDCLNCHLGEKVYIRKGFLISLAACPNCGCDKLVKR